MLKKSRKYCIVFHNTCNFAVFCGEKMKKNIVIFTVFTVMFFMVGCHKLQWSNRSPDEMNWPKAIEYCRNLNESGHSDWRLPDIDELRTLIKNCPNTEPGGVCKVSEKNGCLTEKCWNNKTCYCERKNEKGYYNKLGDDDWFWSYSTSLFLTSFAWGVDFARGYVMENNKLSKRHYARCVRDGITKNSQESDPAADFGFNHPVIMGTLTRSNIDDTVSKHLPDIRSCYENELKNNPKLHGRIAVNFVISATGGVKSAKVQKTTLENETVESCVADQIKKVQFPTPKRGGVVIVTYPFVFEE